MTVWILYDWDDRVEGVYSQAGREKREEQLYNEALRQRGAYNEKLAKEIKELRDLRKPCIIEAEILLDTERAAKENGDMVTMKNIRKQRKILIKQADRISFEIGRKEEKILASQRMTRKEILSNYQVHYYWEEYQVIGE